MPETQTKTMGTVIANGSKIAGPTSGLIGALSDVFSPLAPFAPIILSVSLLAFLFFFFSKVRPELKVKNPEEVYSGKNAQIAGFSLITTIVMIFFMGITSTYSDEGGALAANIEGVKNFQERILDTLDEISEKQDVMLEKQDAVATDVKDIKEIVTGEADIKQLASTEDYSTFEEVNKRTDISDRKTIAIMYFDNNSKNSDLDPLRKGLADMLISDLSNLNMLRVVEREKLEELLNEINLSNTKEFDQATQQKMGKLLGVETMLFGSYFELLGRLQISAKIVKTETGEILKSEGVNGAPVDFMKLEKQLVWKIARGLDVRFDEKEEAIIMASASVSYDATIVYAEGLELYDDGDKDGALKKFKQAVEMAPDFSRAKEMIIKLIQT